MRKFLVFLLFGLSATVAVNASGVHRVGTYNIRYRAESDSLEKSWNKRKASLVVMIRDTMNFDVLALQEVADKTQRDYIHGQLEDVYTFCTGSYYGVELAYRTSKYTCMDKGTYYLAPDVTKSGKAWDAQQTRWVVWAKLKDQESGEVFVYAATHLDLNPISIREGARVCVEQLRKIAGNYPCMVAGDMNCEPINRDPHANFQEYMGNARDMCKTEPQGSYHTFASGMNPKNDSKLLDYLFVHNVEVESYFVNNSTLGRTLMPSDHMPLVCEVRVMEPSTASTHKVRTVGQLIQEAKDLQAGDVIYLEDGAYDLRDVTLELANTCTIEGSENAVLTGANQLLLAQRYSSLSLRGLTIRGTSCPAGVFGSVVNCTGNYLKMQNCRLENCETNGFGLVYAKDCNAEIDHCVFMNNSAPEQEGGVYITDDMSNLTFPLSLTNCLFENNYAYHAPAVYINSKASAYLYGNSFIGNRADEKGAVLVDAHGNTTDIRLVNNTFANNRIEVSSAFLDETVGGSAIWQDMAGEGRMTLVNNTVVGNYTACWAQDSTSSPTFQGGAIQSTSGALALYNNIIAGNYSSCAGRGDVSMVSSSVADTSAYNVFSSEDNTNFPSGKKDFRAASFEKACTQLVELLGGEFADGTYYRAAVKVYGENQDVKAIAPVGTQYGYWNIAAIEPNSLSAGKLRTDIFNVGSCRGTLTLDQAGNTRLSPTVPGAMEVVEPTDLREVENAQCTMHNAQCTMQSGKVMKEGQLRIVREGKQFNAMGVQL